MTLTILAVGATGSIGRLVVEQALADGHRVRALIRDPRKAALPAAVERAIGDLTKSATLTEAVREVDAVVFTHGSSGWPRGNAEAVDYGGVRNLLLALDGRKVRIALMTTIGVTDRKGAHDWKRRGERLVRASGLPYTIVRPGWFDYNGLGDAKLLMLQGDRRQTGTPVDGAVSRRQLAQVLVRSLTSEAARNKTFELVAVAGPAQQVLEPVFAALAADQPGSPDGPQDAPNMPPAREPAEIRADLARLAVAFQGSVPA